MEDLYASASGSESGSESGSDTGSETQSETSEEIEHDGRMQALDAWRRGAAMWINGSGREPVRDTVLPPRASRPDPTPAIQHSISDVPIELRANDFQRHILNIDSQFRENPEGSPTSDFYFRLLTPIKNVLRVRMTSIEFPNNYPFFTALRGNTSFLVTVGGTTYVVQIEEGNYEASDMVAALNSQLPGGIQCSFSAVTGKFTFTHTATFTLDFTQKAVGVATTNRTFAYGLGYYLGFSRGIYTATFSVGPPAIYTVVSNQCAHFAGDSYLFLKINDFDCVRHTMTKNDFTAMAKVVLREPKNYMAFDDYASQHIKEVVFPAPRDLSRFRVQILDAYGEPVDMCSAQISFSLEVLEILNQSLYDSVRDSIMTRYV